MRIPALPLALLLLSATFALAEDPPAEEEEAPRIMLQYAAPDSPDVTPEDVQLSTWEPGAELATVDRPELRSAPSASSQAVRRLPIGTAVRVVAREPQLAVRAAHVGHWYKVSSDGLEGYLFGADLTPFAFKADMDGDGAEETATIAFTPDFRIRVRVKDGRSPAMGILDLEPSGGAYVNLHGGDVEATLHPASESGIPLIEVHSYVEACADYTHRFVSYAKGVGGVQARLALELAGLTDPPTFATFEVRFDPAAHTATVEHEVKSEDEQGNEVVEEKRTVRYKLSGGVFKEQPPTM